MSKCPEMGNLNHSDESVADFLAQVQEAAGQPAHVMSFDDIEVRLRAAKKYGCKGIDDESVDVAYDLLVAHGKPG